MQFVIHYAQMCVQEAMKVKIWIEVEGADMKKYGCSNYVNAIPASGLKMVIFRAAPVKWQDFLITQTLDTSTTSSAGPALDQLQ